MKALDTSTLPLLNMVEHEVRTPVNGILGLAWLLKETELSDEQKEYVALIQHSADDLMRTMNNIGDLFKMESAPLAFKNDRFDLREVLEDVKMGHLVPAKSREINFKVSFEDGVPTQVEGDAERFKQVLFGLVTNAIKLTRKGELVIIFRPDEKLANTLYVEILVTGDGLDENFISKVEKSFSSLTLSDVRPENAFDVRLFLAKKIVQQWGGDIGIKRTDICRPCWWFTYPIKTTGSNS